MRHFKLTPCHFSGVFPRRAALRSISFTVVFLALAASFSAEGTEFRLEDATIADINNAFDAGILTSERLVQLYLNRIEAYDKQGPALNAIISLNPDALATARALDEERQVSGARGPLHGIPVLLKDSYDFAGMPTTAGVRALAQSYPPDDAFQVRRLREAGAVILGKTNMDEFALDFANTSSLGGQTYNPYDTLPNHGGPFVIPGGSSGGTGVALAANFATLGTGADTGGSIRVPSAFNSVVGIKPTMGLTSRDGMVPMLLSRDIGGPMARTVSDAAVMLDVLAGYDPADPVTAASIGQIPSSYTDFLDTDGLRGARIGYIWGLPRNAPLHPDVATAVTGAKSDMESIGAEIVTLGSIPYTETWYNSFEHDLNDYLRSLGSEAPMKSLSEIVASGKYLPKYRSFLVNSLRGDIPPEDDPRYDVYLQKRESVRTMILQIMDAQNLDAILYPTATQPPPVYPGPYWLPTQQMGLNTDLAAFTGFPAITVPGGFTSNGLPVGIEFMARPFDEPMLISFAYAYEQATQHRQPPTTTPPLPGETIPEPGAFLLVLGGAGLCFFVRRYPRSIGAGVLIFVYFTVQTRPLVAQQMVFPGTHWEEATPESVLIDSAKLDTALQSLKSRSPSCGVNSMTIIRNGRMIWSGSDVDAMYSTASAGKSVTSTILGKLIDNRTLTLDTLAKEYAPNLAQEYPNVTMRHFATMTSGYRPAGNRLNEWGWTLTPLTPSTPWFEPGEQYFYQDPMMEQLSRVLTQAAQQPMETLFQREIADPIGMDPASWDWWDFSNYRLPQYRIVDGLVHNLGSGEIIISAREAARFGHLFLNRGDWDGQQLVSEAWVDEATRVQVPATLAEHSLNPAFSGGPGVYGYNWWVNGVTPDGSRLLPGAPPSTYFAHGAWNNYIFVIPEWNAVVVRLGNDGAGNGAPGVPGGGEFEIPNTTWSAFFSQLGAAGMTAIWDGAGDGNWEDFDPVTGDSRWLADNGGRTCVYPDDLLVGAVVAGSMVTVADDHAIRQLTVGSGGLNMLSTATLSIADGLTLLPPAQCDFQLGDESAGSIAVTGDVALAGTLGLYFSEDMNPVDLIGTRFHLFDWENATLSGTFDQIATEAKVQWDISNLYTTGEVILLSVPLPGDLNGDAKVNDTDLDLVRANWGQTVPPETNGDANGDGSVDTEDLDIVRANWGASAAKGVPEPSCMISVLLLCLVVAQPRWRS